MSDKSAAPPPARTATPRQALLECLDEHPLSAKELSGLAGLSEKDVYLHLEHLQRSHPELKVEAASCLKCGFHFEKRGKLTKPGRCPLCKATRINPPRFSLKR